MGIEVTTLCYIVRGDEVLMLHRTKKKSDLNEGKWIGVGGHVKAGESPYDCVMRETLEEIQLKLGELTDAERDIIKAGCLINYYRG